VQRIGSGTGIFTRALLGDPEWNSAIGEYIAIEPSAGMRSIFEQSVSDKRIRVQEGTFQSTGVGTGWADLIVIAQVQSSPDLSERLTDFFPVLGLSLVPGL
jgi:hypothetical protein